MLSQIQKMSFLALVLMHAAIFAADKPNILVIMVDDMGYGDPGCYNPDSQIKTSNIDSLAKAGMRFTDAHAPGPLCHMSRYGLITGRYPFRTKVGQWRKRPLIETNQITIGKLLQRQGYRTAMVGKWHLGFAENGYDKPLPGGPVDCGFDQFFGIRASTDIPPYFYIRGNRAVDPPTNQIKANASDGWSPIQGAFWRAGGIAPNLKLKDVLPRFTDEAVKVIEGHKVKNEKSNEAKPLFLYLAYPAPHTPWLPSAEFVGKSKAGMYGDFAMMVDSMIGRVLEALDQAKMSDDTLVIFTSDNGPVWYEEDVRRLKHDSSGGLRGMKADAWECGHRMPFIVRWPGKVKPGSVSEQTICFTDLMVTFGAITGAKFQAGDFLDSVDFSGVLLGTQPESRSVRDSLVIYSGGGLATVRMGQWKLITGLGSGGFSRPRRIAPKQGGPKGQLYDLSKDLAEEHNLYAKYPEIVARLEKELKRVRNKRP